MGKCIRTLILKTFLAWYCTKIISSTVTEKLGIEREVKFYWRLTWHICSDAFVK